MFDIVREDFKRVAATYKSHGALRRFIYSCLQYGFLAICVYRFGRWARQRKIRVLRSLLLFVYIVLRTIVEILFGIEIDLNSEIGPGFYIGHFSCIVVTGKLGRNCSIGQGVTIGSKGAGRSDGWPVLGDNVYIGAGAKIIGSIRLGSNVVVGANAVVIRDVPSNSLAIGVPAKVIARP